MSFRHNRTSHARPWGALLELLVILVAAPVAVSLAAPEAPPFQKLWPGRVPLGALANFRAGYQFFGKNVVYLPPGQPGDHSVGAACEFQGPNLFMHPAYKQGPGLTFVEYFVELPATSPLVLKFETGISRYAADNSDGVQFTLYVGPRAKRKIVYQRLTKGHGAVPGKADLSPWAGEKIVLGLEVHPGPKKDTSYDWAFWYKPELVIGRPEEQAAGRPLPQPVVQRLRELGRSGAAPYLTRRDSMLPSLGPLAAGETHTTLEGNRAVLRFRHKLWQVTYELDLTDGTLDRLFVRQDDGQRWQPCKTGGLELAVGGNNYGPLSPLVKRKLLSARAKAGVIRARYRYEVSGQAVEWELTATLRGPCLQLAFTSRSQLISALSWGRPLGFRFGLRQPVPYMNWTDLWAINDGFLGRVLDLKSSAGSLVETGRVQYRTRSDGTRNPLRETLWVGYVPLAEMALPNLPHKPSPYLKDMAARPVIDVWGGSFSDIEKQLLADARYGVDHCFIIIHNWQRAGYDVQYPDVLPANKHLGGDEGLRSLCRRANQIGHRICVHENYVDFYPDAPSYDPKDVALDPHGKPVKAYLHPSTHIQSFLLRPLRARAYAEKFAPEIHRRFGTTGAYLDVHTAVPPWGKMDYDASQPGAGRFTTTWRAYADLFAYMRQAHQGPLTGEGNNHALWAGMFDGAEAQVTGGEDVS
ncbi:MAG: hypothetical protein J7M26_07640, partial [Armatimonadetes bacterium]|nr:hypothetical protein [Armatimonadota bacterium]